MFKIFYTIVRRNILELLIWFAEKTLEDNPYQGYFTQKQMDKLLPYITYGLTADAELLGLASKFELEACTEYLLNDFGLVLLQVFAFRDYFRHTPLNIPSISPLLTEGTPSFSVNILYSI